MYKENDSSSIFQEFPYGEITADGIPDGISEPSPTSTTKLLAKIVNGVKPLTFFEKNPHINWLIGF